MRSTRSTYLCTPRISWENRPRPLLSLFQQRVSRVEVKPTPWPDWWVSATLGHHRQRLYVVPTAKTFSPWDWVWPVAMLMPSHGESAGSGALRRAGGAMRLLAQTMESLSHEHLTSIVQDRQARSKAATPSAFGLNFEANSFWGSFAKLAQPRLKRHALAHGWSTWQCGGSRPHMRAPSISDPQRPLPFPRIPQNVRFVGSRAFSRK